MRAHALMLVAPRRLVWAEHDLPPLGPQELLVRTTAGAISCGSELPAYRGDARTAAVPTYPRMTGYESTGVVLARGEEAHSVVVAQRVVAFYGHRDLAVVPESRALPVPEDIPDDLALLSILSCDVAKAVRAARLRYEECVLITGAGAIGLLYVFTLRALGLRSIDIVEPRAGRRALALAIGARQAWSPDAGVVPSAYDAAFECSARDAAFGLAQAALRVGGRLGVLSDGNIEPLTLTPHFHQKELTTFGSSDGWDYRRHASWFFEVVRGDPYGLRCLFDYRISAAGLVATFSQIADSESPPLKVLVRYGNGTDPVMVT